MITIKQIVQNATVTDGSNTIELGAGGTYTCSEPTEKLHLIFTVDTSIVDGNTLGEMKFAFRNTNNFSLDWGDGSPLEYYNNSSGNFYPTHQYAVAGVYDVKFEGRLTPYWFGSYYERKTAVKQWGKISFPSLNNSFNNESFTFPQDEHVVLAGDSRSCFSNFNFSNFPLVLSYSLRSASTMFSGSNFDYDIGYWDMASATTLTNMFSGTSMSIANCDSILTGWTRWDSVNNTAGITLKSNMSIHMGTTDYTRGGDAEAAHDYLVNTLNWTITFS